MVLSFRAYLTRVFSQDLILPGYPCYPTHCETPNIQTFLVYIIQLG
jgi:hypothetical protein